MKAIILSFTFITCCFAQFNLKIYQDKVEVTPPKKRQSVTEIVLDNKSLNTVRGEIAVDGSVVKRVSMFAGKIKTISIKVNKKQKVSFIPVSPPAGEVPLLYQEAYEIPKKR